MKIGKASLVIAVLAPGLAMAAPGSFEWKWSGVYVGASIGRSDFRDACSGVSFCDQKDTAWKGFAG